jgi:hypothetical protein
MIRTAYSLLVAGALALTLPAQAQSPVDVGLFQNGSRLEVRVRPNSDFSGIFSSLVFTIRWDRATGATLGDLVQEGASATYMPVMRSGGVHEDGAYNYQIFAGFGYEPMQNTGETWEAGREYVLLSVPVTGKADFELINDSWTAELRHNGNYYVSLGGRDMTGVIYKDLANASDDGSILIQPNPNSGMFAFSFGVMDMSDVRVELVNTLGQSVYSDTMRGFQGNYRREMDLSGMSNGVYYLKVTRGDRTDVEKVIYR